MKGKTASGIMLALLLISVSTLTANIQPVSASGTIYIKPDGTVDGTDKIQRDDDVYTFTDNIYDEIVVQIDNIVIDGAGYTLQGTGSGTGISLSERSNVTIKNIEIVAFSYGIFLWSSSNNSISGNNVTLSTQPIPEDVSLGIVLLFSSSYNTISGNNVTNTFEGIKLQSSSSYNNISGNKLENNYYGITISFSTNYNNVSGNTVTAGRNGVYLMNCLNNIVSRNNITTNSNHGILLHPEASNNILSENYIKNNNKGITIFRSSNNFIYHNNLDNTVQVYFYESGPINFWDDGYPSGGNFWSDYTTRYPDAQELDDSCIWDTPYVIDENNQDNYPLMEAWAPSPPLPRTVDELKTEIEKCWSEGEIDNQGIVRSLIAKLDVAERLVDMGRVNEAKTVLECFIIQVQKLSEICITVEAADILIKSAEYILSNL
jgi:parallel beta-helix repeat protein